MPNAQSLLEIPELRILLVSPPGSGKTTFAGTARAVFGPMYVQDFDLRIEALAGLDVDYDSYPEDDPKSFDRAYEKLESLEKKNPYKIVMCDGLTMLGKAAMKAAMPLTKSFMPNMTRLGNGKIEVPGGTKGADYNTQMTLVENYLSKLRKLSVITKCHVFCTAHELVEKNDDGKVMEVTAAITGQLAGRVPGYFNEYYRCEGYPEADSSGQRRTKVRLITQPDNLRGARTNYAAGRVIDIKRGEGFEKVTIKSGLSAIEVPDMAVIYRKMREHTTEIAKAMGSVAKS